MEFTIKRKLETKKPDFRCKAHAEYLELLADMRSNPLKMSEADREYYRRMGFDESTIELIDSI